MNRQLTAWVVGGGIIATALYWQRSQVSNAVESGVEDVTAAVHGWKAVNQGPVWVPVLNVAERGNGIPTDLLARIAYQESRFRPDVIDGTRPGGAGELGIMQMLPQYFTAVRGTVPFSSDDTANQINQAAAELARLYGVFFDWGWAIAGYNDGQGNIQAVLNGQRNLPASTAAYVADVLADVPVTGATIPG